jgi:hypothetical protein
MRWPSALPTCFIEALKVCTSLMTPSGMLTVPCASITSVTTTQLVLSSTSCVSAAAVNKQSSQACEQHRQMCHVEQGQHMSVFSGTSIRKHHNDTANALLCVQSNLQVQETY